MKCLKVCLLALLAIGALTPAHALKNLVQRRQERLEYVETQWQSPEKVTINIHYRVPVIETIGYLAVNYDDPRKLGTFVAKVRPIALRVNELSGDTFEGRTFPPTVEAETQKMRSEMMAYVTEIYGAGAKEKLEAYLKQKYHYLSGGIFSPLN